MSPDNRCPPRALSFLLYGVYGCSTVVLRLFLYIRLRLSGDDRRDSFILKALSLFFFFLIVHRVHERALDGAGGRLVDEDAFTVTER